MNLEKALIVGLAVACQEQTQILTQCVQLVKTILEDDYDEILPDPPLRIPRRVWMNKRYGLFWERDIPNNNDEFFKESFRMEKHVFAILVNRLEVLRKKDTNFRQAIPLEKRIAIALYTLGSSSEYRTVGRLFGVSVSTVCKNFMDDAVDHYNYKGWYSVVLFALVDIRYRFLYVNIGCPGRFNDSQIYRQSQLSKMIESSTLLKEKSSEMCGTQVPVLLIGDSAFKFSLTFMKPYPFSTSASLEQKTFNYNLSRVRRVVENSFGHVKARFRRIGKGLANHPKFNNRIIMCCCILHNFLNHHNCTISDNWNAEQGETKVQQMYEKPLHNF